METGPIRAQDNSSVPGERVIDKPELNPRGQISTKWAETQTFGMDGQVKIGRDDKFEVLCDELARLGGKGERPQPLTYLAMGVKASVPMKSQVEVNGVSRTIAGITD